MAFFLVVQVAVRFGVFFFQAEDGIRGKLVTGVQTCALPICRQSRNIAGRPSHREAGGLNGQDVANRVRSDLSTPPPGGVAEPRLAQPNLGLELVRATEAAALSAGRWMGNLDREGIRATAANAMVEALRGVHMNGTIVIGEDTDSVENNLQRVAFAKKVQVSDLTVVMLDRPRHEPLMDQVRQVGARITLLSDGDIAAAIMATLEGTGIDVMLGVGGLPEAVLAACALKCLGGEL